MWAAGCGGDTALLALAARIKASFLGARGATCHSCTTAAPSLPPRWEEAAASSPGAAPMSREVPEGTPCAE